MALDVPTAIQWAAELADVSARPRISREIAERLGVERLLVLVPDPELGLLLPAPGWPQTIPDVAKLRAALAHRGEPGLHRLRARLGADHETPVVALSGAQGTVLALVGGDPSDADLRVIELLFPLLASTVRAEVATNVAEGNAASAREASRRAQELATALDATRAQLEASLRRSAALAEEADRARQRVALLDRVTRELVGGLGDVDAALAIVARATVPTLADGCAVYVPASDGAIRLAAVVHEDATAADRARRTIEARLLDPSATGVIAEVMRSGLTVDLRDVDDGAGAGPRDDGRTLPVTTWGTTRNLAVALRGHEGPLGVLELVMTSSRAFTEDDRSLAEEIANRAAVIVEQRRLLGEARAARREAELANRAKDEFLAMLGHEIRNPLAPITTALSLMKMRDDGALRAERAVIERQIRHVVHLVDDLLDVSRITRGKIELRRETMSIQELTATAAEMAMPLVEEKRHHLTVDVEPGVFIHGDRRRLAQVVANLLNNAAKYTPDGGSIQVRGTREGDTVVIRVRDDGCGMPADLLPRVFELFAQAPQTAERARGGLGLGLAIVKTLVELHGGEVAAASEGIGKGSELLVRLPASAPPSAPATPLAPVPPSDGAPRRRVLIVDDNEDAASLLTELLRVHGHEVEVAFDGPTALERLERFTPDAACLDIGLPVMDGYELARRIRARLPRVVLVAVTGYGQATDRDAARAAGFDRHLVKPVDVDDVVAVLRECAEGDGSSRQGLLRPAR